MLVVAQEERPPMMPDENSPTLPNEQVARPPQHPAGASPWGSDDALPMPAQPNAPPAANEGRLPTWSVPAPPKPPGFNNRAFGVGLAIGLVVLAVLAIGLLIVLTVKGNTPSTVVISPTATATLKPNPQTPTSTPLPPIGTDTARNIVTEFFSDINSQQYQNAYNLFSSQFQSGQSLSQFQQPWQNVLEVTPDPNSITATQDSSDPNVMVNLSYSQVDQSPSQTLYYQATFVVGYDQGQARILSFQPQQQQVTPTPTSTPPVTPTTIPPPTSPTPSSSPSGTPIASPTA
jgi:hypothetical protein